MDQKALLYALAASGLVANAVQRSDTAMAGPQKEKKSVECYGINTCKGTNGCGLATDKAELAIKVYKDEGRYLETKKKIEKGEKLGECAGTADGSAKAGHLSWVDKKNKADCLKAGGFVYLKEKDGTLKIEDSKGVKGEPKAEASKSEKTEAPAGKK